MTQNKLGARINALRREKKLTLDQLAAASGSSKSYIWELENKNPPRPSAEKLADIAKALGVTADYLIGSDDQTRTQAEDIAFFRQYSELPDDTRKVLREMAESLAKMGKK
ncbi:helix-turn-helix domain-containing protein [Rhizobium leguminosarum]|uniref:helix-turn-helix domain-containing protein n=1 Tax=Rhizobium leguminosarum TaxID=384 RepID=UPI001038DC3E|nr:helix-turn-helix transcriptional regulator [Rhizobium leguminosarum]TCA66477.1 helix-turn-helix domain-containing protein [Rhizobium leguminosarum bv. viciae]TCB30401.1 helix-turn-helix domain-containing protein [Rhizobium leguminosarum bv. viciae]